MTREAADDSEEVLPATAGATEGVLGMLCCSFVGSGFGDLLSGGGARCTSALSLVSWPADSTE
jgi:hypothetical protein